jgi:hypothetical protein
MSCCEGLHDVQARLDRPGQVRFVTICAHCGREQRELGRRAYTPAPRLLNHDGRRDFRNRAGSSATALEPASPNVAA